MALRVRIERRVLDGHRFLLLNQRRDRLKMLGARRDGLMVVCKRPEMRRIQKQVARQLDDEQKAERNRSGFARRRRNCTERNPNAAPTRTSQSPRWRHEPLDLRCRPARSCADVDPLRSRRLPVG